MDPFADARHRQVEHRFRGGVPRHLPRARGRRRNGQQPLSGKVFAMESEPAWKHCLPHRRFLRSF